MNRRSFLIGLLASAAAAPAIVDAATFVEAPALPPIFKGWVGTYNGVVIREAFMPIIVSPQQYDDLQAAGIDPRPYLPWKRLERIDPWKY